MTLCEFREKLQGLMDGSDLRPFVCDGSPLGTRVFIVGFNPATSMNNPFWHYWSDHSGFDKQRFMSDYLAERELDEPEGVRARIERIVAQLPRGVALETNICSKPTRTAAELKRSFRRTQIFRHLLDTLKPRVIYAHSNKPIEYLEELTGASGFDAGEAREVTYAGQSVLLLGTRGPLFSMSYPDAEALGGRLLALLRTVA